MRRIRFILMSLAICMGLQSVSAATPLRRPISTEQPMWLIHIDTWNTADPQKIIDMVPEDIRPYVVFNLSLSINHREDRFLQVEYGYETAKSWLRTCAENRVWAMVQPSSGAFCHFPDDDMTIYEEFFRDYPNFLGFNFCEQFWGFGDPYGVTYEERLNLYAQLMKLNVKYGGYLCWSWCNSYHDADRNAIALFKRNPELEALCKAHPENFIACEKFTMTSGFHDVETVCLGAFLSGYAGNYGIRFDETGWRGNNREKFPVSAGVAPVLEHLLLTGLTVVDGPETIPNQECHEINAATTPDGFTTRQWEFYPQFYNISMDIFRKISDGTIRLLSRQEVIDRTKIVLINDVNEKSDNRDVMRGNYITPETLYDGLYKMPGDGTYLRQYSWFKSTGRYPAIPMVYALADKTAQSFQVKVNVSDYAKRWPDEASKVKEFNSLFEKESDGDCYVGRVENRWVIYNPFKTGQVTHAVVPFKYNTCDRLEASFTQYSAMLMTETAKGLELYINNYDNAKPELRTDTITIYGVKGTPAMSFDDRLIYRVAGDKAASVTSDFNNGTYTLYVKHNGPLDIHVSCAGSATGREKKSVVAAKVKKPSIAPEYAGPLQYEAENFDYKGIEGVVKNGVNRDIRDYTAQGYIRFGRQAGAAVTDMVTGRKAGDATLTIRYIAPDGARTLSLQVGGQTQNVTLPQAEKWATVQVKVRLAKGQNKLLLSAAEDSENSLLLDNIVIE